MKKALFVLVVFWIELFSISLFAQTPQPTPPDVDDVVKISTNLIQIDVTVTDKKGNLVTDLNNEDFEIYENGKRQSITNFSFVNLSSTENSPSPVAEKKPANKNAFPIPTVKLKPENVRRTYAIAVDDLGLSFTSIYWTQQALKKFVNEQMQEGDLVAIIRTSGGIGALQSFTSDKRLLLAAISKIRWNSQGRVGVNSFEPIRESLKEALQSTGRSVEGIEAENTLERQINDFRNDSFAVGTLGALNYIVRGMKDLPGRKAVMLLSEGFQLTTLGTNNPNANPNFKSSTGALDAMRLLADQANRSSVVFYTLDPRGLVAPGASAEDQITNIFAADGKLSAREDYLRETQGSLRYLAEETGGIAFVNQNDLNSGLKKVISDQKGYYLIAYQPDEETFDPKKNRFNNLTIKIKRPDLKLRYRSGFFGVSEEKLEARSSETPHQKLASALVSPFGASGININLYSAFYNDERDRNFIRTLVYIDPKDLTFTSGNDGLYRAKFDIIAMMFDANGAAATNNINSHILQFSQTEFDEVKKRGIIYDLPIPVTKTGAYQFRVALQDSATSRIGAASQFIEIPNLSKKRLALSNLILRNYTLGEWQKVSQNPGSIISSGSRKLSDTVIRQFKAGSMLTYFFEIYNAKTAPNKIPQLFLQTRLFRDGKMLLEGNPLQIKLNERSDLQHIPNFSAITLGSDLQPGDYALQVVIYDKQAKEKSQIASQSIDFEIVE